MAIKFIFLPTDILLYLLFILATIFFIWASRREHLRRPFARIAQNKIAVVSVTILFYFITIGLLDSIHFQQALPSVPGQTQIQYNSEVKSVLDLLLYPAGENDETTYSAPMATHLYNEETINLPNGEIKQIYPLLNFSGHSTTQDVLSSYLKALAETLFIILIIFAAIKVYQTWQQKRSLRLAKKINPDYLITKTAVKKQQHKVHYTFLATLGVLIFLTLLSSNVSHYFHLFGTDKIGQDVFYEAIKSIRTGLILGTLTTLVMLPFALILGTMAGYFGGITDDIIQYIYTTLSSIPGVLLIAASVLALQIFIDNHDTFFTSIAARADIRLLALCFILGITSWTSLCRLLRGETLKLREMDYVVAARALGVSHSKIILRHILPNVMHIVLITIVLDFSGLVLAEAVLTYVGVGVDPITFSWGNMINSARLELAREPAVWWPLFAAFILMFAFVLTANLVADSVRAAFDPRAEG